MTSPTPPVDLGRVVAAHNAIKDARTVLRHAYEDKDADLEKQQNRLRAVLLAHLNTTNTMSVKTAAGTFYRTEKIKPSVADWGALWEWMKEHEAFEIMEKRVKATFVKEYMDENAGAMPPGVNVHREYEVSVRRSNTPAGGPEIPE